MAKGNTTKCMCIGEMVDGEPRWNVFATYYDNQPHGKPFFHPVRGPKNYLNTAVKSGRCLVRVFEYNPEKRLPNGSLDVSVCDKIPAIEVTNPPQFRSLSLRDEDAIRRTLKEGFQIPEVCYTAFREGGTQLALIIPSENGAERALLFTDKDKLKLKDKSMGAGYVTLSIAETPTSGIHALDSIPIANLDYVNKLQYQYTVGATPRMFLECDPEREPYPLLPYSAEEFAPIYFSRILKEQKTAVNLSSGRTLTKDDIRTVITFVEESLKDQEKAGEYLQVSDPEVVQKLLSGIRDMLPDIRAALDTDQGSARDIRDMMMADPDIHDKLVQEAKQLWMAEKDESRIMMEQEQAELQQTIARLRKTNNDTGAECERLTQKLSQVNRDIQEAEKRAAKQQNYLKEVIQSYRHDLATLIRDTGVTAGPLPYIVPSQPYPNIKKANGALAVNLFTFLPSGYAASLSSFLSIALQRGLHLAVDSTYAPLVANAISYAQSGMTATAVVSTDPNCSFAELKRAIEGAESRVVLVEGVFGSERDLKTLALIRHCVGKILVFSIDEPLNLEEMGASLYRRVAILDDLPVTETKSGAVPMQLEKELPFGTFQPKMPDSPGITDAIVKDLWAKQVERR